MPALVRVISGDLEFGGFMWLWFLRREYFILTYADDLVLMAKNAGDA